MEFWYMWLITCEMMINIAIFDQALKSKFQIDKILVVPVLESFILRQDKYPDLVQNGLEIIGR